MFALFECFFILIVKIIFGEGFEPVAPLLSILSFGLFFVFYGVMIGGQIMLNLGMDKAFLNIQVLFQYLALLLMLPSYLIGGRK
jgi:PST family polysaccharide transporter